MENKNTLLALNSVITTLESLLEILPNATLKDNVDKLKEARKIMVAQMLFLTKIKGLGRGTWIVDTTHGENGTYYQYDKFDERTCVVTLARHGHSVQTTVDEINTHFRLASESDVQRHLTYLASKGYPKLDDKTEQYITLKPEFKRYAQACATIANVNTLSNEVLVGGVIYNRLKGAGVLDWFETVTRSSSTNKAVSIDPLKCEFYMVTCRGEQGSKVRHINYDDAIKEAKRVAKLENHPAWVVGVVAMVTPN